SPRNRKLPRQKSPGNDMFPGLPPLSPLVKIRSVLERERKRYPPVVSVAVIPIPAVVAVIVRPANGSAVIISHAVRAGDNVQIAAYLTPHPVQLLGSSPV